MKIKIFLFVTLLVVLTNSLASTTFRIVSLKDDFIDFIDRAQGLGFEEQLRVWENTIEKKHFKLFHSIIYQSDSNNWQQRRISYAKKSFPVMFKYYNEMLNEFEKFNTSASPIIQDFLKRYPREDYQKITIYVMPSMMTFNGRVDVFDKNNIAVLIGVDFLAKTVVDPEFVPGIYFFDNISILVSHELTHAIHSLMSDYMEISEVDHTLLMPLWMEGIAQLNSELMVPTAPYSHIFMERSLAESCTMDKLAIFASHFLQDLKEDPSTTYNRWFSAKGSDTNFLLPLRVGYCLGYHVAKKVSEKHSMDELLTWPYQKVNATIIEVINQMALSE